MQICKWAFTSKKVDFFIKQKQTSTKPQHFYTAVSAYFTVHQMFRLEGHEKLSLPPQTQHKPLIHLLFGKKSVSVTLKITYKSQLSQEYCKNNNNKKVMKMSQTTFIDLFGLPVIEFFFPPHLSPPLSCSSHSYKQHLVHQHDLIFSVPPSLSSGCWRYYCIVP